MYLVNPPAQGFRIRSEILGEKRTVLEFLPAGYESSGKTYPVLLLLDASPRLSPYSPSFRSIAEKSNFLGSPVPEMIVLGIVNTDRNRDMLPVRVPHLPSSGGAALFLRFITEELVPKVKSAYRTSEEWILFGRSDSGLFALYALTEAPEAFRAVIASSPTLGHCPAFMNGQLERLFRERQDLSKKVFIIYGADEGPLVAGPVSAFAGGMERSAPENFVFEVRGVPGGGHAPKSGLEEGLRFAFSSNR